MYDVFLTEAVNYSSQFRLRVDWDVRTEVKTELHMLNTSTNLIKIPAASFYKKCITININTLAELFFNNSFEA